MKVIVVTGGIGSGKSASCRFLNERFGWPVYNADKRVKDLYLTHPVLLDRVELALGKKIRDPGGSFSPSALAKEIFSDRKSLEMVEELVFPVLLDDFERWKSSCGGSCVILESATILEKPLLKDSGDVVLVIDAPVAIRAARAAARDGISVDDVRLRMKNQPLMNGISEGLEVLPDVTVIMNDASEEKLYEKLLVWAENTV